MTDDERQFEKFLRDVQFDDTPDHSHRDKLEKDLLRKLANQPPRHPYPNARRMIIQRRIAKLAAAAITIAAVFAIVHSLGGRVDGTSVAWAQVLANIEQMNWVHLSQTLDPPVSSDAGHRWACPELSITAYVYNNGEIVFNDYGRGIGYYYNPQDNTITLSRMVDRYTRPGVKSPLETAKWAIEWIQKNETKVIRREKKLVDGTEVQIIETPTHRLTLDFDRNLLLGYEGVVENGKSGGTVFFTTAYDYPTEGPQDIYALGAPHNAKVIDVRQTGEAAQIVEEVQRRYWEGFGNHIAMVATSYVEEDGSLNPWVVLTTRQKGDLFRQDCFSALDFKNKGRPTLYSEIKDFWPHLKIEQMLKLERNALISMQVIYDGTFTTTRFRSSDRMLHTSRHRGRSSDIPVSMSNASMSGLTWFEQPVTNWAKPFFIHEYELLETDDAHAGLIGIRISRHPAAAAKALAVEAKKSDDEFIRNETAWTGEKVWTYWIDPDRDYMVMERIFNESSRTLVLETRQTPEGKWYPSHILHEYPSLGGKTTKEDKRISILTDIELPDQIFDPNYVFNAR